jgi:hypothetical protein
LNQKPRSNPKLNQKKDLNQNKIKKHESHKMSYKNKSNNKKNKEYEEHSKSNPAL